MSYTKKKRKERGEKVKNKNSMNKTQLKKLSSILLLGLLLTSCANNLKDGNLGALVGSIHAGGTCLGVTESVEVVAACAVVGGVLGANAVWNDDFNVHKSYFVDHLIGAPNRPNYTNWYNPNTKNSGIIKTTRTWYKGPIKCRDYSSTIDITPSWPFNWVGSSPIRKVNFGTACIMPDGRVEIQK